MGSRHALHALFLGALMAATPAIGAPFLFDNGNVDGRFASASRPAAAGGFEIESADDFTLTSRTSIDAASFTGLLPAGTSLGSIGEVRVEIYRIFPNDSNVGRTSGSPAFSTAQVPTRINSPSDMALDDRGTVAGTLSYTAVILSAGFSALNSLQPGGINPAPNQTTGGNGAVTGQEVRFDVSFSTPFDLPADHYFFIPQVALAAGDFLWLSSVRPIVPPGTPFAPDLQAWARDQFLDPDWLRVGTDVVGGSPAPTFNLAFALQGQTVQAVPEPASLALLATAIGGIASLRRRLSPAPSRAA